MSEDKKNGEANKGFAGLTSLLSDVETSGNTRQTSAQAQCLSNQLAMLGRQARRPNLSNLSYSQRQSIEAACSLDKYLNGPATYNDCLVRQLQQLR